MTAPVAGIMGAIELRALAKVTVSYILLSQHADVRTEHEPMASNVARKGYSAHAYNGGDWV